MPRIVPRRITLSFDFDPDPDPDFDFDSDPDFDSHVSASRGIRGWMMGLNSLCLPETMVLR
ncbi:MAG: hypothetical protein PHF14_12940 [Verrucomicrobiota bacterium]|jgi:hypothetical protein|nr:hypothetical protein [Verrucomicrobiota bacterium]MDD8047363.1 hypothetical protein [Verrucomicrobiota bacterium]MDI9384760.1 hypothetical protein [Verrucomicrobiota bacterium]